MNLSLRATITPKWYGMTWNNQNCLILLWLDIKLQGNVGLNSWGQWLHTHRFKQPGLPGPHSWQKTTPHLSWWHGVHLAHRTQDDSWTIYENWTHEENILRSFVFKDPKLIPDGVRAHLAGSGALASDFALAFAFPFLGFALSPCCKPLAAAWNRAWRGWPTGWRKYQLIGGLPEFIPILLKFQPYKVAQVFPPTICWTMWAFGVMRTRAMLRPLLNILDFDDSQCKTVAWPPPFDTKRICRPRSERTLNTHVRLCFPGTAIPAFSGTQFLTWWRMSSIPLTNLRCTPANPRPPHTCDRPQTFWGTPPFWCQGSWGTRVLIRGLHHIPTWYFTMLG